MILPICGISTTIPSSYDEIIKKLRLLGLSPTGNPSLDRSRLANAIENRVQKLEEQKKEEKLKEEISIEKKLEEERIGAQALAEQNKIFFNL